MYHNFDFDNSCQSCQITVQLWMSIHAGNWHFSFDDNYLSLQMFPWSVYINMLSQNETTKKGIYAKIKRIKRIVHSPITDFICLSCFDVMFRPFKLCFDGSVLGLYSFFSINPLFLQILQSKIHLETAQNHQRTIKWLKSAIVESLVADFSQVRTLFISAACLRCLY